MQLNGDSWPHVSHPVLWRGRMSPSVSAWSSASCVSCPRSAAGPWVGCWTRPGRWNRSGPGCCCRYRLSPAHCLNHLPVSSLVEVQLVFGWLLFKQNYGDVVTDVVQKRHNRKLQVQTEMDQSHRDITAPQEYILAFFEAADLMQSSPAQVGAHKKYLTAGADINLQRAVYTQALNSLQWISSDGGYRLNLITIFVWPYKSQFSRLNHVVDWLKTWNVIVKNFNSTTFWNEYAVTVL